MESLHQVMGGLKLMFTKVGSLQSLGSICVDANEESDSNVN